MIMKKLISELKPHPFNTIFGDLPKEEFNSLKEDIKKRGMQTTIDITENNIIICGHQRTKALKELGINVVEARILSGWDDAQIKEHLIKDNILRRQLTEIQIVEAGKELEKIYGDRQGERTDLRTNVLKSDIKGQTRDIVAKDFGISGRTYERYKKTYNKLEESGKKDTIEKVKRGELTLKQVKTDIVKEEIAKQKENIKTLEQPRGKYNLIVIDPPWESGDYDSDGFRAGIKYPSMSLDEIRKIKLPMADDCIVWVWGIDKYLKETLDIIEQWGLKRKGTFIWDKVSMGMGKWLRFQHEYCFLCIKGKPKFYGEMFRSVLNEKRTKHSTKPDGFYSLVENASPYKSKLDYFARKKREGWDVYGDEVKFNNE